MSLRNVSQYLEVLGVERSHVAIHEWVHKADRQPISTVTADRIAVDEKMIRLNGDDHWLYGAVDPATNEIIYLSLFPTTTNQTTRWVLAEFHRRCLPGDPEFPVDGASYLGAVLDEDGYRFQVMSSGNRNAIECVFCKIEPRT
jgi:transposase-like protein